MLRDRKDLEMVPLDEALERWLGELEFRGLLNVSNNFRSIFIPSNPTAVSLKDRIGSGL